MSNKTESYNEILASQSYFLRLQQYHNAITPNFQNTNHGHIQFWYIFALGMTHQYSLALSNLQTLQKTNPELEYPILVLQMEFSRIGKEVDEDQLQSLQMIVNTLQESAEVEDWVMVTQMYIYLQIKEKVIQSFAYISSIQKDNEYLATKAFLLQIWYHLFLIHCQTPTSLTILQSKQKEILPYIQTKRNIDGFLALSKLYEYQNQFHIAFQHLQTALSFYPNFIPLLIEKCKLLFQMKQWDVILETRQRLIHCNPNLDHTEVILICLFIEIVLKGYTTKCKQYLDLYIERSQNLSHCDIWFLYPHFLPRLGSDHPYILQSCVQMLSQVLKTNISNPSIYTEFAYLHRLQGNFKDALSCYQKALKMDGSNTHAQFGTMHCQVFLGEYKDVQDQMDFLTAIHHETQDSEMLLVHAIFARMKYQDISMHLKYLHQANVQYKKEQNRMIIDVLDHYSFINPSFLKQIAHEFLYHIHDGGSSNLESDTNDQQTQHPIQEGLHILHHIISKVPGDTSTLVSLAKLYIELNRFEEASNCIEKCLKVNNDLGEAYLMSAYMHCAKKDYRLAQQELDRALSLNFQIKKHPLYCLIKSDCFLQEGNRNDALLILQECTNIMNNDPNPSLSEMKRSNNQISIYIKLASILSDLKRHEEADKVLSNIPAHFQQNPNHVRILIAQSKLASEQNKPARAIRILDKIPKQSDSFSLAQIAKADIYWNFHHDKKKYVQIFQYLVKSKPSCHSWILLGEAYMKIQSLQPAIESFENALDLGAKNDILVQKIGNILITTHKYQDAVQYYEKVLHDSPNHVSLRCELASLHIKTNQLDDAERIIREGIIHQHEDGYSLQSNAIIHNVTLLLLLANVQKLTSNNEKVEETYQKAKSLQMIIVQNHQHNGTMDAELQKNIAATINHELGACAENRNDYSAAIILHKLALNFNPIHFGAIKAIAKLSLKTANFEQCQKFCDILARNMPESEVPMIIIADMKCVQLQHDDAIFIFEQLLQKNPNNFAVLEKMILIFRKTGKLMDAPKRFEHIEKNVPRSHSSPGFHYCKGLFHRFTYDMKAAILHLNRSRNDGVWGEKSSQNIVEIYLNPKSHLFLQMYKHDTFQKADRIQVIEKILLELDSANKTSIQTEILKNYFKLLQGEKHEISQVIQNFQKILENNKDFPPGMLGLALAYMSENSESKARNTLKKMAKNPYHNDFGDAFESCYLILADSYIQRENYELAQDLCKRCLVFNKSCSQAWEMIGAIMEKALDFKTASECYEKCWNLRCERSADIGYKLAFNYMKSGRMEDAINICQNVLLQFPDFQKIKDEILLNAMMSIRP